MTPHTSTKWLIGLMLVVLAIAGPASAENIAVPNPEGSLYVGGVHSYAIVTDGFSQQPTPTVDFGELPDGLRFELMGVSPRVSTTIKSIGGRTTRRVVVNHVFQFAVAADAPGEYIVGPFKVEQDDKSAVGRSVTFKFREIENDPNMIVDVKLPPGPFYEGQEVPLEVQWGYAGDLRRINSLEIRSPIFDAFEFRDAPATRNDRTLPIITSQGGLDLPATYHQKEIGGRDFVVVIAKRILLAENTGNFEFPAASAVIVKGDGRRRSLFDDMGFGFGRRPQSKSVPLRSAGQPISFKILPLPTAGRPASFNGAIGSHYELDIQANRSVVRVGDPISLIVTVRGDGNLEKTGLPKLNGPKGLPAGKFRFGDDEVAGSYSDGQKQFNVAVRVEDESVAEIPPVEFSWFDPDQKKYVSTLSQPIVLNVKPAQIVSSEDVISNRPVDANRSEDILGRDDDAEAQPLVTAADYSIATDVEQLVSPATSFLDGTLVISTCYLFGFASLVLAVLESRRRQEDPNVVKRRRLFAEQADIIRRSAHHPVEQAIEQIASALRRILPEASGPTRVQTEELIAELENLIYQPGGVGSEALDHRFVDDATGLVERIRSESSSK